MTLLENVDKAQLKKILLIVISALTLIALALLLVIIVLSIDPKLPTKVDLELEDTTVTDTQLSEGALILADADHKYSPNTALFVDCKTYRNAEMEKEGIDFNVKENLLYMPYTGMQLEANAMAALHTMLTDAAKANTKDGAITIDAAYGRQENISANEEFNTGLLVFLSDKDSDSGAHIAISKSYVSWFDDNAAKYGFVESFEYGYRYVGVAHAKYITDEKLTLASYIEQLKKNTSAEKPLTVFGADGAEYAVYYTACVEGNTIKVPLDASYEISGTNEGGVIVTVKTGK